MKRKNIPSVKAIFLDARDNTSVLSSWTCVNEWLKVNGGHCWVDDARKPKKDTNIPI